MYWTSAITISGTMATLALFSGPIEARARPTVTTDSAVFVERTDEHNSRRLEPARYLARGDRVVTIVNWTRQGGAGGFVITNPLPARLAYAYSASDEQDVSVDGGHTWGQLSALRVGTRPASARDVTHIRWRIPATRAALGQGRLAYAGVVR